jgi:hypothetical protein
LLVFIGMLVPTGCAKSQTITGTVTVPIITDRPGRQPFAPHPGWVDLYGRGESTAVSARIGEDGHFDVSGLEGQYSAIASFDVMETHPIILPRWNSNEDLEIPIVCDYACIPLGYPEIWDASYTQTSHWFFQTFRAKSKHLYSCSAFDGKEVIDWGNKLSATVREGGPLGPTIPAKHEEGPGIPDMSASHTRHGFPHMGWRHGDIALEPGKKYAIGIRGYESHGGQKFLLDSFICPEDGNGYMEGMAYQENIGVEGDLCLFIVGNLSGQVVENQVRTEEWEIMIPKHSPAKDWGQSFVSHGVSMAGVAFWGSNGSAEPVTCEVSIREDGPGGRRIGPTKTAVGHESPKKPIIRYPDWPGPLEGYDSYYEPPFDLFQASFLPEEVPLTPGESYYIELRFSEPVMLFADGEYYPDGYGYYDGRKMEEDQMFHSKRWTLAMGIVTYENKGGAPNDYSKPRPEPGPDGNLVANGGAETGDFSWWKVGADPMIDPPTDISDPPNYSGEHRFGISVGWQTADFFQFQEIEVEPGMVYRTGLWMCHANGTDEEAELLWIDGAFGGKEVSLAKTAKIAEPEWKQYEAEVTPTGSIATLVIRYRHAKPTDVASIHVDDVYLIRK